MIRYPGSGSADPDPHQNEADPKHFKIPSLFYKIIQIKQVFSVKSVKMATHYFIILSLTNPIQNRAKEILFMLPNDNLNSKGKRN